MRHYPRLKLAVFAVVLLGAAASAVTWHAAAAPSTSYGGAANAMTLDGGVEASPVPGGPGFYSLSAFAFSQTIIDYGIAFEGPELYNKSWDGGLYRFAAPVSVPSGATVTKFVLYFWDSSANDLSAALYRVPLDGNPVEKMAEVFSADSPGYGHSAATLIHSPVIDQQAYAYCVEVSLPYEPDGNVRLRGIRIDYGYVTDLPLVTKQH